MLGLQPASHLGEYVMDGNGGDGVTEECKYFCIFELFTFSKEKLKLC